MKYFVRPREGLRDLADKPSDRRDYVPALLEWRRTQLQEVWLRIAGELSLTDAERAGADEYMRVMPGTGYVLLDDSRPKWEFLAEKFLRLRRLAWILVWYDGKLPPLTVPEEQKDDGVAQPWHLVTINAPAALTGKGVSIGVIDTGYDPTLEDLKAPFTATFADYHDPTSSMVVSAVPVDHSPSQHGSKVCAYLAGTTSGVAKGASVYVAGVPASDYTLSNQGLLIVALEWLFTLPTNANPDRPVGCDVITTSIHTSDFGVYDRVSLVEDVLKVAVFTWHTLVVGAIGNAGAGSYQCPGASDHVVGVGATAKDGTLAYFSASGNTGGPSPKPDIVAPGNELELPIAGVVHKDLWGTSFAAPIVAGAAALILEDDPTLRTNAAGAAVALRAALLSYVTPLVPTTSAPAGTSGVGLLNLAGL